MSTLPFQLINEVDTTGFGDTAMRLGDLDGDGELEVVWFHARDCHIPRMSAGGYRHGVLLAPWAADAVADALESGDAARIPEHCRPERFGAREVACA